MRWSDLAWPSALAAGSSRFDVGRSKSPWACVRECHPNGRGAEAGRRMQRMAWTSALSKSGVGGLVAVCLVAMSAGAAASPSVAGFGATRPQVPANSTATVELSRHGEVSHSKVSCNDLRGRVTCARLAELRRRPLERCLQIWGGPERAVIHLSGMRPIRVTRADSCEIARWAELQKLLP